MVLVKNWRFLSPFVLGKMCRKKLFSDVLDIIAFLHYKNINTNRLQTLHFSKCFSPWFWSKIGHFFDFSFLGKIGREKLFNDLLDRIIAFLDNKTNNIKRSKNLHFSKGDSP